MMPIADTLGGPSVWLTLLGKITVLLAAAWMAHWLLLGRNPRWRVMLWRSVMAGLVLLPALEVMGRLMPVKVPAPTLQIHYVVAPTVVEPVRHYRPYGLRPAPYESEPVESPKVSALDWAKDHATVLVLAAWSLVAVILAVRTLSLLWRVRSIVKGASAAPAPIVSRMQRIAEDLRCSRNVLLRLTGALVSPFLTRILRPVILLPEKMVTPDRYSELEGVLSHELAHVRGNDLVWLLLGRTLSCIFWFHPLIWRMAGAHAAACEEVCDAVAAEYVGGAPAYTGMLARVALELMTDAPADGGVGMIRAANILHRVRLLKRGIRANMPARRWVVTALSSICLGLLTLGTLKIAYADKSKTESTAANPDGSSVPVPSERKNAMASVKHEGSRVWVDGLGNQAVGPIDPESQMRLMEILLKHRGEATDANQLLVLSGDAFNTCHPAHWQGGLSHLLIATDPLTNVARAYGYDSHWLNSNLRFYQINKLPPEQKRQKLDELHQAIRKQIEAGKPVLMGGAYGECGSWRVVAGIDTDKQQLCYIGGEKPYDWFDIQKDPKVAQFGFWDEQVRGAIHEGFMGSWQSNVAFVLTDRTRVPSEKERLIGALKVAVDLFQDREHNDGGMNYLGRRAYAEWAKELAGLDYPADKTKADPKAVFPWYSLESMAFEVSSIVVGRAAAADYIDSHAAELPKVAENLKAAAEHYRKEVAIAKQAFEVLLAGDQQATEAWISNKTNRDPAATAVRSMLAQEEAAVAEIGKALDVEGVQVTSTVAVPISAKVKREGDKVWIEGVNGWSIPEMPSSVQGAQTAAMQALGEKVTYEELMGASGLAFRMQISKDVPGPVPVPSVCPSSPHAYCGWQCSQGSLDAIPWTVRPLSTKPEDVEGVAAVRKAVMESIDRGVPVQYGSEEDGLIVGYQKGGEEWLCLHPYSKGGKTVFVNTKWPWGLAIFTERKTKTPSQKELAAQALRQAVAMAEAKECGIYYVGFAAWEDWIQKIPALDSADDKIRRETMQGNSWIYFNLVKGREAAAVYLRSIAPQFGPEAADHLRKAADLWQRMADEVLTSKDVKPEQVAPGPWDLKTGQTWRLETRADQVRRLKAALPMEREAIGEVAKALEAEGLDKQPLPAAPGPRITKEQGKVLINDVPTGAEGNGYARGLDIILRYLGDNTDYDTIMGDSGQAFVLQAEEGMPIQHGAVDVGWWPLASWTIKRQLPLLSNIVGRELTGSPGDIDLYQKDPAEHYRRFYEKAIRSSIDRGVPVLVHDKDTTFVVAGYDGGTPPLLGDCSRRAEKQINRAAAYPWELFLAGQPRPRMDRKQADLEVLRHAVALGRDQVWPKEQNGESMGRHTGQRAFQLWADCVRDTEHPGESRWHSNMVLNLGINRRSAVAWLRAAAKRQPDEVAQHLNAAADIYANVVAQLPKAGPAIRGLATPEGRASLVQVIEYVAALEARATNEIAKALAAAGAEVKPVADADLPKLPAEPQVAPAASRYPVLGAQATTIRTGGAKDAQWAVLEGEWSVDPAGCIVGRSGGNGYLYRVEPHADDVRVTATLRAVDGGEVTIWMCGSPAEVEHVGYTLAVATTGAKLQRKGKNVQEVTTGQVKAGKDHVVTFERSGATLRGFLDGATKPFVEWTDPQPLRGEGHGTLGFYVYGGTISIKDVKVDVLAPQPASATALPARLVLPDVPRVGFDLNLCPLPGSVLACMKYLGDPVDYDYVMGASGAAFRRLWQKDDGGNVDLMYLAPDCYQRLFDAIGYACRPVSNTDKVAMVREIQGSLQLGRPVIAFGVIGPPEACVVTGYDKGGDVLIGWNYFQKIPGFGDGVEFEPAGYFRKADWAGNTRNLLIIGDKRTDRPSDRTVLLNSLKWAIDLARTSARKDVPGHVSGLAAYDAWASALEVDADYPKGDAKVLALREMVHMDQKVMLEERKSAARFLRAMAKVAPEAAAELETAAGCYDEVAALSEKVWPWGNQMGQKSQQALAEPATRRQIAGYVRAAGQKETQAVEHLANALALLDTTQMNRAPELAAQAASAPAGPARLDFSSVTLRGNACAEDSFAKAVQAAAKLLGRDVDLQTIQALTTNVYAPNIRTCEPCKSWWDVQAQDTAIDLVARRIGLKVEMLPAIDHSADPPMPKDKAAEREWLRTYYRKPIVPAIRKALDAGQVVIAGNEWDFAFHSIPWFAWGIITDAGDDGTILGISFGGRRESPLNYVLNAWVLSPAESTLNAHQADVETLRLAVDRIRGNTQANRADECGSKDHYVFGLEAMDAWINAMETIPGFCAECQARGGGWSDALDNGKLMHNGAVSAASCLRKCADTFPSAARSHLEAAAKQYDRISQLLHPAVTTDDPGYYKTFIGDLAKQKVHADQVLRPVRTALASAGDEMATALAVEGVMARPAKVRPTVAASQPAMSVDSSKDKPVNVVKLEGLKQPKMWMTRPGCIISCAQYLKLDASSAWIYGATGYAFALNIAKDVCPSGPTAWPSEECDARAGNVGLAMDSFGTDKRRPDFADGKKRVWEQATAALDAGRPCMAWEMDIPDWYVVYGHDSNGELYFDSWGKEARKSYTNLGDSAIGVVAFQSFSPAKPADDRTVVREAIRFAVDHGQGKGPKADWYTGQAGLAGYDAWIAALTDEQALKQNKIIGFGMGYNAACWNEARKFAVRFLVEARKRLDDRKLDPLFDEAIAHYSVVSANLTDVSKLYPNHDPQAQAQVMDSERRSKAVAHLKAAKEAESKGLVALAKIGGQLADL